MFVPGYEAGAQAPNCNGKPATTTTQGTEANDVFVGTEGNDTFNGGEGNDSICGLGGDDTLIGYIGDDYIDGGVGTDRLIGCDPSHEKSDAIVCYTFNGRSDSDILVGGDGDDHVFGQVGNDALDGGLGFDVLDGGTEVDDCRNGERYAFCEQMDPPQPPPACSDSADNDGDAYTDMTDPGCTRPRDPTEEVRDDPECFNGNDDDGDGSRDYPEDRGCESFSESQEYFCVFCPPVSLSARYLQEDERFVGHLNVPGRPDCTDGRRVNVKRLRTHRRPLRIGTVRTHPDGGWELPGPVARGRYFAAAPRYTYFTSEGDDPYCPRVRSENFRVR